MEEKLNQYLADLAVVSHKIQALHWYVKGPHFDHAHLQLEGYYDQVSGLVDEIAECMLMIGFKPIHNMKDFLDNAQVKEYSGSFISPNQALDEVEKDYQHLLECVTDLKKQAEEEGLDLVSIKADAQIEAFSKVCWMLGQR